ncbi:solute carrier family 35 member G1-like [Clavelina lepadiformis]|uniref:solute carrier family 35 member G1-like n=1 Tax=Clavelina lepadiformis TaxID=159417 RepID=UPI0040438555
MSDTSNEVAEYLQNKDSDSEATTKNENDIKLKPPFYGFGVLCCVMSAVVYSFNSMLVKLIESVEGVELSCFRCAQTILMLMPYITYNWKYNSIDIFGPPGMFKFLLLRGFTGSCGMICLYQAVQRISVGDAVTLQFSYLIFTGIAGHFVLGDSLTVFDGIMSTVAMIGIVFISRPAFLFSGLGVTYSAENYVGVAFGLCSALFAGTTIIVLRKLGSPTHASLNILYYSLTGAFTTTVIMLITGSFKSPCLYEVPYIILLAVTGVGGQVFMTIGLRYERAGTYSILRSFQICLIFILQVTVLHDTPSYLSLIGAGLMFTSLFAVASRKLYHTLQKQKRNED